MKKIFLCFPLFQGSAFSNGKNQTVSFVGKDDKIKIATKEIKQDLFKNIFFIRGILYFFLGTIYFFKFLNLSIKYNDSFLSKDLSNVENKSLRSDILFTIIGLILFVLGVFLLAIIPSYIYKFIPLNYSAFVKNLIFGLIKVFILYLFLFAMKIIPSFKNLYSYNGAINKCVRVINKNGDLNFDKVKKESHYLSTNYLSFIVFVFLFSTFVISLIGLNLNVYLNILVNCLIFIFIVGLCYEFLALLEKQKWITTKLFVVIFSSLVVNRPSDKEIETVLIGLEEAINMCDIEKKESEKQFVFREVYNDVKKTLIINGIDDESEADWLIATVLSKSRAEIKLIKNLNSEDVGKIKLILARRIKKEPLSKIFGFTDFYGLRFIVDKNVLSPRMETEEVVENAIKIIKKNNFSSCLDIGTGSGAIAITLKKNTNIEVTAVDISKSALEIARKNAKENKVKVKFIYSDLFNNLKNNKKFDIIVSNPPYLETKEIENIEDEVKNYDPLIALDGGNDGLDFYRQIAINAPNYLSDRGMIVLEISYSKAEFVKKIFEKDFSNIKILKDNFGNDRILIASKRGLKWLKKH